MKWKDFGKLNNCEQLDEYINARYPRDTQYCHYTSLKIINSILGNRQFWFSCVDGFNDENDKKQFYDNPKQYYSLCFSTGINENLSLWYMYSGMDGKGGRIRLTRARFIKLIEQGKYELCELSSNKELLKVRDLDKEDLNITIKDIIYYRKRDKFETVDLKYSTMTNYEKISYREFNEYKKNNIGFFKKLAWYYEKELRVLIKLKEKLDLSKKYVITLTFDEEVYKNINIDFAPEVTDVSEVLDENPSIKELVLNTSKINLSEYSGEIHMSFCKHCTKKV